MKEKKEKQRDRRKRKMEKNHGITLVALVITIIIMLILVGVSITVAINGGLFGTAENAKDRTKTAVKAEQKLANGRIKIGDNWYASINDYPDNPIETEVVTNGGYVGNFVQYDIAYTDVYKDYQYTNKNGWRILRYETTGETIDDKDIITNVEIISTGIPAKLQYQYDDTTTNKDAWWETDSTKISDFRTALKNYWDGTTEYPLNSLTGANVKAAAGMYNNFASIPFIYTETNYNNLSNKYNIGWYKAVTHGENGETVMTSNKNGGELFLTGNADKVRMLTLPEINKERGQTEAQVIHTGAVITTEPAPGLFRLNNLPAAGLTGYTYNTGDWYWLASPYSSNANSVPNVNCYGSVYYDANISYGVRPAVSLGSDIHYNVERESENGFSYLVLSKVSAE